MKIFLLIILVFVNLNSFAINAKLSILGDNNWKEGEVKQLQILIWPLEDVDKEDMRKTLENKVFCDYFFIGNIISIKYSQNNPLALIIEADATLKKAFNKSNPIIWSYRALNIPVETSNISPVADPDKIQDFYLFERDFSEKSSILTVVFGLIVIILLIIIIRIILRRRTKKEEILDWKKLVLNAKNREEIEKIYFHKKLILESVGGTTPVWEDLFNKIYKHQYKQLWDGDEISEINFVLDEIKESLK